MGLSELLRQQPAYLLWLLGGLGFVGMAMLVGEPTLAALGFAAVITAIVAITIPTFGVQLFVWAILSFSLAIVFRGLVPRQAQSLQPSQEGKVITHIPPRGEGEVSYEGTYWQARCQISDMAIAVGTTVYVVGRQGNTLIVLPGESPMDVMEQAP